MQRNTGYFPTESLEPSGNRLFSRSALNEGDLFRGSLYTQILILKQEHIYATDLNVCTKMKTAPRGLPLTPV
jgi:hypothetical protein